MDARPFADLLDSSPLWLQRLSEMSKEPVQPDSDLWVDEQVDGGHWGYHLAAVCLQSATDHLVTLLNVLTVARIVPFRAGYTLARGALEPGLLAYWLLEPNDSAERLRRAFSATYEDYSKRRAFENEFPRMHSGPPAKTADERMIELKEKAERAGCGSAINNAPNITDIALRCGAAALPLPEIREPEKAARWLWRWLSGTAHGLMWPLAPMLDVSSAQQVGKHKGAMVEADERLLLVSTRAAANVTDNAIKLLIMRRTSPIVDNAE